MLKKNNQQKPASSWDKVGGWYHGIVGDEGHYYHQKIILPGVMRLFKINDNTAAKVLDLACGQGVLARQLPAKCVYSGVDLAASLIKAAKASDSAANHEFIVGDVSRPLPLKNHDYTHAAVILALQNIEFGEKVVLNAAKHMVQGGVLVIVLNHPCFRIPRQSSWGIDEAKKTQYRRIERYQTPMQIPIQAHPSKGESSPETWSFHHSLSDYSLWLSQAGFHIDLIEEWCSDKVSTGKMAKMENRSREEFPLFMTIRAIKK
jgi:ubiquinone/menaquinone biosynthesis C-methylase UbiE